MPIFILLFAVRLFKIPVIEEIDEMVGLSFEMTYPPIEELNS